MTFEEMQAVFENVSKDYSEKLKFGDPQQVNSQFHFVGASELTKALDDFRLANDDVLLSKKAEDLRESFFNSIAGRIAIAIKRMK